MVAETLQPEPQIVQVGSRPVTSFYRSSCYIVKGSITITDWCTIEQLPPRTRAKAATSAFNPLRYQKTGSGFKVSFEVQVIVCFLGYSYVLPASSLSNSVRSRNLTSPTPKIEESRCPPLPKRPKRRAPSRNGHGLLPRPRNLCWRCTTP
jgi:hypothetical protein